MWLKHATAMINVLQSSLHRLTLVHLDSHGFLSGQVFQSFMTKTNPSFTPICEITNNLKLLKVKLLSSLAGGLNISSDNQLAGF